MRYVFDKFLTSLPAGQTNVKYFTEIVYSKVRRKNERQTLDEDRM